MDLNVPKLFFGIIFFKATIYAENHSFLKFLGQSTNTFVGLSCFKKILISLLLIQDYVYSSYSINFSKMNIWMNE